MVNHLLKLLVDNFFVIVTALIAIVALIQTNNQIKISNKQYLFERRLKNFSVIFGMITLFENNKYFLEENHKEDEQIDVDFVFYGLINNSYLEDLHYDIDKPLEQPYHNNFLIKLEEISSISKEIGFIYNGFDDVSIFISSYKDVLHAIYKYKNIHNEMLKTSQTFKKSYVQCQKLLNEPFHREKLLDAYKQLVNSYKTMTKNKSIRKMQKQIKL